MSSQRFCRFESYHFRMNRFFNTNQKYILFEIINKFFLFQIEQFNIKLKLQFKLDSNFKLITIHRLILEFFSLSKKINLIKFKESILCEFKSEYNNFKIFQLCTLLNLETLLLTNKIINDNILIYSFKGFVLISKFEKFYRFLNSTNKLYFSVVINNSSINNNILIFYLKKLFINT